MNPTYKVEVGDQKSINQKFQADDGEWKPILMSALSDSKVVNGVMFAVIMERITK